jgi:hypothetical protein
VPEDAREPHGDLVPILPAVARSLGLQFKGTDFANEVTGERLDFRGYLQRVCAEATRQPA